MHCLAQTVSFFSAVLNIREVVTADTGLQSITRTLTVSKREHPGIPLYPD